MFTGTLQGCVFWPGACQHYFVYRRNFSPTAHWRLHQCFGSVFIFSGSGSRGWGWRPIRIRIQSFNDQKLKKNYSWKKVKFFFDQKLQFTYPKASIKNVQVTEEAYSSQMRPSNTSKREFLKKISTFVGHFCPPGSGSGSRIRIRIHWPDWIRIQSGSGSETLVYTCVH